MKKFLKTAGMVALFTGFSALAAFGQNKPKDSTKFKPTVVQKDVLGVQLDKSKSEIKPGKARDSINVKVPNKAKSDAIKQGIIDYSKKTPEEKRIADSLWNNGGRDAWKRRNPDSLTVKAPTPAIAGSSSQEKERLNIFLLQKYTLATRDTSRTPVDTLLRKEGPIFTGGYIRRQDVNPKLSAYNMGEDGKNNTTLNGIFFRAEVPLWTKEWGTYQKVKVKTTFPDSDNQSLTEYLQKFVAKDSSSIVKELRENPDFQKFMEDRLASEKTTTVGGNAEDMVAYLANLPKDTTYNTPVKKKKEKTPFQKVAKVRLLGEGQFYEKKEAEGILRNPYKNPEDEYFNYKNGNIAAMYNNVRFGVLGALEGQKGPFVGSISADAGMILYPTKSQITVDGYPQIQDQINKDAKDVFGGYARAMVSAELNLNKLFEGKEKAKQGKLNPKKGWSLYADADFEITSQNSSVRVLPMNAVDGTQPYKITGDNKSVHFKAGLRYRF